jgi:DNA-binding CsgD family transcriptional regulator
MAHAIMGVMPRQGELEVRTFRVGNEQFALLSLPELLHEQCARLTPSEREVVAAVLRGVSNAALARARGVSLRTIANQLASAFSKLGVRSRSELAARWP